MISLIVGLGNHGKKYCNTRHNAGYWLTDQLASYYAVHFSEKKKLQAQLGMFELQSANLVIAQPLTFMNNSGLALQALASWYKLQPEQILIAHDELDLPPGSVRLKLGGGHGGHNGLRDVIRCLGSSDFARLRIGIGHPGSSDKVLAHVLKPPSMDDRIAIDSAIDRALKLFPEWQQGNWDKSMQELHSKTE